MRDRQKTKSTEFIFVYAYLTGNKFVFQYNFGTHLANHALISRIDDVIVTNQRRISASQNSGMYYGTRLS